MITLNQAVAGDPTAADAAERDWVLRLSWDESGRLVASGVPFGARGSVQVFLDGLLYDRCDLARISGLPLHASDEELVLAAYATIGESLIPRLRGSFAMTIVDRSRNIATVVRDPIGSHPLFFTRQGSSCAVASSQLALLSQPGVSRSLNRAALADHLCQRWPQVDETYFEAITRVAPGCRLILESGEARVERHWDRFSGPVEFLTPSEADRFDEQLARAVGRCFGHGRTGIFLSGGFDSVSVAAVAADHARAAGEEVPMALSLAFPHPDCDERLVQTSVARSLGLPQEMIGFMEAAGSRGLLGEGLALTRRLGAPLFNTWMPAYLTLARRGRLKNVRTILTGEGGDEWLNVSPYLSADLIRRGDLAGVIRLARTWYRSFDVRWFWVTWSTLWTFGLRPLAGAVRSTFSPEAWDKDRAARRVAVDPAWIAPDEVVRLEQKRRAEARVVDARPQGGFYARELHAFLNDPLMSLFFEEQYELGRAAGVRFQHPYWDPDLVEHMYRTPPEILTRGNRTKGLVRAAVDRRFPGLNFESQRKVLAFSFFASVAGAEANKLAPQFTDFSALAALGVVEPAGARSFVANAFDKSPRTRALAWRLITLEAWARTQIA
jgi:asparagine synthetase B (glutamine-hydrolysing)